MLGDLKWETLETRRAKSQLTMMFKIMHGLELTTGTFGVLPMVPLVLLPLMLLVAIGTIGYPNGYWLSLATFLLVVNNESRSSFATAVLQQQIYPRVLIHNIFATSVIILEEFELANPV